MSRRQWQRVLVVASLLSYAVALLLPAYRVSMFRQPTDLQGYMCAYLCYPLWAANILLLVGITALFVRRAPWLKLQRLTVPGAGLAAALVPPLLFPGTPLVGHYLWLAAFVAMSGSVFVATLEKPASG